MIVPFVMSLSVQDDALYTWAFYKWFDEAKKHKWPMIAQEIYFTAPSVFAQEGRWETMDTPTGEDNRKRYSFALPRDEDLELIQKYLIPKELDEKLIAEKGTRNAAYCFVLQERWEALEALLSQYIEEIQEKNSEPVEAICTLCHYPSLSRVAAQYHIPVFHYELGPIREPCYFTRTAYFDRENLFGNASTEQRYQNFLADIQQSQVPILTKKEILAVMLKAEKLPYLSMYHMKPPYKMGVALGAAYWPIFNSKETMLDSELLYQVKKRIPMKDVLVRKHPGDFYGAQYKTYRTAMDRCANPIEFILQCREICTLSSNVAVEALLWGKTTYIYFDCPGSCGARRALDSRTTRIEPNDRFLSFFVFAYLIPYDYLTDVEYIRWRLTEPSEHEIYMRHLTYYMGKKGLPLTLLDQKGKTRLRKMLDAQAIDWAKPLHNIAKNTEFYIKEEVWKTDADRVKDLEIILEKLQKQHQDLQEEMMNLQLHYNETVHSRAWKLTGWLRRLRRLF